jgi:hypothetical protein
MKNQPPTLAIKLNNCASNDPCELCGFRTDPEVGPELFLEGTWALVCYDCGEKYAPALVEMLMKLRHAQYEEYVAELAYNAIPRATDHEDFPEAPYTDDFEGENVVPFPRQTQAEVADDGGYWNEDGFWVFSRQTESSPVQSNDPEISPVPWEHPF